MKAPVAPVVAAAAKATKTAHLTCLRAEKKAFVQLERLSRNAHVPEGFPAAPTVKEVANGGEMTSAISNSTVVLFYANWCPHSKTMKPIFEQVSNGGGVQFAQANTDEHPDIADVHKIEGYPTIKMFTAGKQVSEYEGGADVNDLRKFIQSRPVEGQQAISFLEETATAQSNPSSPSSPAAPGMMGGMDMGMGGMMGAGMTGGADMGRGGMMGGVGMGGSNPMAGLGGGMMGGADLGGG